MNLAKSTLDKMLETGKRATELIDESDMGGLDEDALEGLCRQAIDANPKAVSDYLAGKEKAVKAMVGFVMKNDKIKPASFCRLKSLMFLIRNVRLLCYPSTGGTL